MQLPFQTDKLLPGCSPRTAGCEATRKISWTSCRIPVSPFVVIAYAGQLARLKTILTILGDDMPQYLLAGYLPDDFDPSTQDEATSREIYALNEEMIAAGVRRFACGLGSAH